MILCSISNWYLSNSNYMHFFLNIVVEILASIKVKSKYLEYLIIYSPTLVFSIKKALIFRNLEVIFNFVLKPIQSFCKLYLQNLVKLILIKGLIHILIL